MRRDKKIFVYLWEFHVRKNQRREFGKTYGLRGNWVKLFRRAKGYVGSELLTDVGREGWYITIDTWESKKSYEAFRKTSRKEFDLLDKACESMTQEERYLGSFEIPKK
jgi:heme-degrading monooxygenase HmoA